MSVYSTLTITREEAEEMVKKCLAKNDRGVKMLSNKELDDELHMYVYSGKYNDEVGLLYNYLIVD